MSYAAVGVVVKPNPPENLEPTYASDYDGHVTLNWNPPTSSYVYETPLRYELNIQNQWQDQVDYSNYFQIIL